MATYRVTAPDGSTWDVTAPDDATEDEVFNYARSQWGQQKPEAPKPVKPEPVEAPLVSSMSGMMPEQEVSVEEAQAAATAGQEYWQPRREPAKPKPPPAPAFTEREMGVIGLGALAEKFRQEPAPAPTRVGPTIEAARQLEQQRIISQAEEKSDEIKFLRDESKRLLDKYSTYREAFAEEYPVAGGVASGTAQVMRGVANAPSAIADAFNQSFVNPVLEASGLAPLPRVTKAFGTEYLGKAAEEYMPKVGKQEMEEAIDKGQFTGWLVSNLAANSPQMAMSVVAAFVPPARLALLPSMGAISTGQSYAQDDDSRIAVAKGGVEILSEMLPLKAVDAIGESLKGLSPVKQKTILAIAGQRIVNAAAPVTVNGLVGSVEEVAAQFGGNVLDKYFGGKNIELTKDLASAGVLGAVAGKALSLPQAAAAITGRYEPESILARSLESAELGQVEVPPQASILRAAPEAPEVPPSIVTIPQAAPVKSLEQVQQEILATPDIDSAVAKANQSVDEVPVTREVIPAEPAAITPEGLARMQALIEGVPPVTPTEPPVVVPTAPPAAAPSTPAAPAAVEAPAAPTPPAAPVETAPAAGAPADFTAPRDIPSRGIAKGEVVTFPTEKQAVAYASEQRLEGFEPREVEDGFVLSRAAPAVAPTAPAATEAPPAPAAAAPVSPVVAPAPVERAPVDFTATKSIPARGIVRGEVLTFKTEKQALAFASEPNNKVQKSFKPRETEDGWVLSKPPRTEAQIVAAAEKSRAMAASRRNVFDTDDLLTVVAKSGGLNFENLEREGFDKADLSSINKSRVMKPFRRGKGMSLDGLTELLASNDFDVLDQNGNPDLDKVSELLQDAVAGTPVYSFRGYEKVAAIEAEAQAKLQEQRFNEAVSTINEFQAEPEEVRLAAAFAFAESGDIPTDLIKPEGFTDEELARISQQYGEAGFPAEEAIPGAEIQGLEVREGGQRIRPAEVQEGVNRVLPISDASVQAGIAARGQFSNEPITTKQTDSPANDFPAGGVRLREGGLNRQLEREGNVSLVGHVVRSAADLAEAAQIYRRPYEVFRAFFVDGAGKIIHQTGVSARLPNRTGIIPGDLGLGNDVVARWFNNMVEKTGAKGFYILHNHPSGDPTPSQEDITSTMAIAQNPRFLGHVVIDTTDFVEIRRTGTPYKFKLKQPKEDTLRNYVINNGIVGGKIYNNGDIARLGRMLVTDKDMSVVIAYGTRIEAIGEIPNAVLMHPVRGPAALRRFARFNAGADVFIYTTDEIKKSQQMFSLYERGFVTDAVSQDGRSVVEVAGGVSPRRGAFGETGARLIRQGEERAIQEPSAEALPVREGAEGRQRVGEGDTEGQEVAGEGRAGEARAEVAQPATPYLPTPWFSELGRQVDKGPESMPAAQWKGWIANRPGIKKDEIYWSGINDWLDLQQGKVTKAQVSEYLKNNGVQVQEVVLGERVVRQDAEGNYLVPTADGGEINVGPYADLGLINQGLPGATRYGKYTLPGGQNYREVLLTLPMEGRSARADEAQRKLDESDLDENMRAATQRQIDIMREEDMAKRAYVSAHWNQPNVIAHIRVNDRVDADGKKVLFVEEIQSDWGQEGKKSGFAKPADYEVREGKFKDRFEVYQKSTGNKIEFPGGIVAFSTRDAAEKAIKEMSPERAYGAQAGIPTAPFVTNTEGWLNLSLKRIITMAYQGEYDAVAFINGEQSADRYDLSKQVDSISWERDADGNITFTPEKDGSNLGAQTVEPNRLADFLGKDIADKINGSKEDSGYLEGVDLKVGGEGMKTFYDQIVPAALKKLLSKLDGGRLEVVDIRGMDKPVSLSDFDNYEAFKEASKKAKGQAFKQPGFYVTDNLKSNVSEGLALFEPLAPYGGNQASVDAPEPSRLDNFIRLIQDRNIDLKRVIERVKAAGRTVTDAFDPYLQEGLAVSRMAAADQDFQNNEMTPLLEEMGKQKLELAEVEEYLHARHAPSRNKVMAERNPTKEQIDAKIADIDAAIKNATPGSKERDRLESEKRAWQQVSPWRGTEEERLSLSGMSDDAAAEYLKALPPEKKAKLDAIAERVDAIIAKTRNMLIQGGVDSADSFNDQWENYVPLHREGKEESGSGYGQGFSVKGKTVRTATGSTRKVVNILANVASAREQAITRVEKNRVANALIGFAMLNPDTNLWRVDVAPRRAVLDKATGKVVMRPDPNYKNDDNVVVARMPDGKGGIIEHAVVFNRDSETAMRIVAAMKGLDSTELGRVLTINAKVTRVLAALNTQYNPVFGIVNLVRDLQSSAINIQDSPIAGKQKELISEATKALGAIFLELRAQRKGVKRDTEYSKLFEEFKKEGGQTGFRDNWMLSGDRTKQMDTLVKRAAATGLKRTGYQAARAIGSVTKDLLSDYNTTLENAIRVAAYKLAKEQGLSKARAAMVAKDVTVNFNRKGSLSNHIGAGYAFFNAAVQGTERLGRVLDIRVSPNGVPTMGPRGQKIVLGGVLIGVAQAMALAAAGIDEDEIPDFIKEKALIFPLGNMRDSGMFSEEDRKRGYITIPMPLGLHILPNLGRLSTELVLNGFKDPGKKALKMLTVTLEAFNPLGAATGWQTLTPTTVDPILALIENKDWTGKPIYRKDFDQFGNVPGFERAKNNPSYLGMAVAKGLNTMTGGTEFTAGAVSPTPEAIDYLIAQATGGPGRELTKAQKTISALLTGEETPPSNIPLVSRFYGEIRGQTSQGQKFYENVGEMLRHGREINGIKSRREELGQAEVKSMVDEYIYKNPEAEVWEKAREAMRDVQKLNKSKREAIKQEATKEEIKEINDKITERMAKFNQLVKDKKAEEE